MDTTTLRSQYAPSEVRVLFVGESPPAGGTFFYASNSNLYFATEAFRAALPSLGKDFLHEFQRMGCYLEDLCLEPVNHLDARDPVRLAARADGEPRLAEQIQTWRPLEIVVVMVAIADNVARARDHAGLQGVPLHVLPFPGRKVHRDRYVAELSDITRQFAKWVPSEADVINAGTFSKGRNVMGSKHANYGLTTPCVESRVPARAWGLSPPARM